MADQTNTANGGTMTSPPANKVAAQLTKLRDANTKYKNLLKMAKERIEQQEKELKRLKDEATNQSDTAQKRGKVESSEARDNEIEDGGEITFSIVRIWQCVKVELEAHEVTARGGTEDIWALIEMESYDPDQQIINTPSKRNKVWKKFDSEAALSDYVRRDTGEPLKIPPYSLTPSQSAQIQNDAKREVTKITEDFRRFRVKAEMARKQADAQIRELQNSNVESAKRRIEGQNDKETTTSSNGQTSKIEKMRAEIERQEAHWKEAYDLLMAENESLKSSGSEAMLASQWRQRYEACLKEKEEVENQLKNRETIKPDTADAEKYEMKYRDLKESFRLYRKKAKEIFEAQQSGLPSAQIMQMSEKSNEDSKLSYLKNLLVNYLTSDLEVREHMEGAIGTVLQFTPEDFEKIQRKKNESGYFNYFSL